MLQYLEIYFEAKLALKEPTSTNFKFWTKIVKQVCTVDRMMPIIM